MSEFDDATALLRAGWLGNLTTLRALQFRCRLSHLEAAQLCGVSPHTYRRWRNDRQPTIAAIRLLTVVAGYVPWTGWDGWEVDHGYLFPPGYRRGGFGPGELYALPYREQLLAHYRRRVRDLEAQFEIRTNVGF